MDSKFRSINKDAGDIGKSKKTSDAKKSVMFSVGQTEVSFIGQPINLFVNESQFKFDPTNQSSVYIVLFSIGF